MQTDPLRQHHFAFFDTAVGACAMVWNDLGIAAVRLPEATPATTLRKLRGGFAQLVPGHATGTLQQAITGMVASLNGELRDLRDCPLDLRYIAPFHRRVYAITQAIPHGKTLTYGEVAQQLGEPGAARAVGQALGHNPFPIIVPCHRVLAARARSGGFSAPGGVSTKLRMLLLEGAQMGGAPGLFDRARSR